MSTLPPPGTRAQRRLRSATERKARKTARWGIWERLEMPNGLPTRQPVKGWTSEIRYAYRNDVYSVLVRPLVNEWGLILHCAITSMSLYEPTWRDKQRIKDELFDPAMTAVEVMPPRDEIVDGADMYHMWVFQRPLPFSLRRG